MKSLYELAVLLILSVAQQCVQSYSSSYKYIMADFKRCQREKPDVVLWVQGRLLDQQRRAVIRELLANKRAWPKDIRVTTFFAVGMCNSRKAHVSLQYEFEVFKDILQNDYHEHYENQTAKMISAITFIADYCSHSKLAIRIDDDVLFHPATMIRKVMGMMTKKSKNTYDEAEDYHSQRRYELSSNRISRLYKSLASLPSNRFTNPNTILCHILSNRTIIRPDMNRPYPVKYSVLVTESIYPDFCAGFFIAISMDVMIKLRELFAVEPPFWIDDSYLGVLQKRIKTVNVNANKFLLFDAPENNLRNAISAGTNMDAIAIHLTQGPAYYSQLAKANVYKELRYDYQ